MTREDEEIRIRQLVEDHWAASERGDYVAEHSMYAEDAILDYPQSGERFTGRDTIAAQRRGNGTERHFAVQQITGSGPLWVSECVITYDGDPTFTVSILLFEDGRITHETQYFADAFPAPPSRAALAERMPQRPPRAD